MIEFNGTFIIAMISFCVFMFIMNAIYYRPILNIIRKREDYIDSNYKDAENSKNETQSLTNKKEEELLNVKVECRKRIEDSVEIAQKLAISKTNEQKLFAQTEIEEKKKELLRQREEIQNELENSCVDELMNTLTGKIIGGVK